jgi:hypothetical protein
MTPLLLGGLPEVSTEDIEGVGGVQTPGAVETGADGSLEYVLSKSQLHRVMIV